MPSAKNPVSYEHIDPGAGRQRTPDSGQRTVGAIDHPRENGQVCDQQRQCVMSEDPEPGSGPGKPGLRIRGGRGVVRHPGEKGDRAISGQVRTAGLPRQQRTRSDWHADHGSDGQNPRRRRRVLHTVSEGDGPVNALDGALRKALLPIYPSLAEMHWSITRCAWSMLGKGQRPGFASSSNRATAPTSGARSA